MSQSLRYPNSSSSRNAVTLVAASSPFPARNRSIAAKAAGLLRESRPPLPQHVVDRLKRPLGDARAHDAGDLAHGRTEPVGFPRGCVLEGLEVAEEGQTELLEVPGGRVRQQQLRHRRVEPREETPGVGRFEGGEGQGVVARDEEAGGGEGEQDPLGVGVGGDGGEESHGGVGNRGRGRGEEGEEEVEESLEYPRGTLGVEQREELGEGLGAAGPQSGRFGTLGEGTELVVAETVS